MLVRSIVRFETEAIERDGLLRSWQSIVRASREQLTDEQYRRFLSGEHPVVGKWVCYRALHVRPPRVPERTGELPPALRT
jgi:hypothetical protein